MTNEKQYHEAMVHQIIVLLPIIAEADEVVVMQHRRPELDQDIKDFVRDVFKHFIELVDR